MNALLLAGAAATVPLLALEGRTVLDHALDRLAAAQVTRLLVPASAGQASPQLAAGTPEIVVLPPPPEGADPVAHAARTALPADAPFLLLDGDSFWLDGPVPVLDRLSDAFRAAGAASDGVLLLHRAFQVRAEIGMGEFLLDKLGRPRRRGEREVAPFVHAGVQLLSAGLFAPERGERAWEDALESGRLRALVHDGLWFRVRTLQDLEEAEQAMHAQFTGAPPWAG